MQAFYNYHDHLSVPEKDISPISKVVLCLVKVAAIVHAASPVDCWSVEVLLMIGRELCLSTNWVQACDWRGIFSLEISILCSWGIAILKALLLHIFQLIQPILTERLQYVSWLYLVGEKNLEYVVPISSSLFVSPIHFLWSKEVESPPRSVKIFF